MPLATASHEVMPPKTLTNTDAHRRVVEDDVEAVGHHLGRGAAADVEEVRRLDAAVLLAGVGDDVERGHDQPGAVADDADLAVELDVVEVLLLGLLLERVGGLRRRRSSALLGLAEVGVVVEGDLAVERDDAAVADLGQRVDLDQRRVGADEGLPQLDQDVGDRLDQLGRELRGLGDLARLARRRRRRSRRPAPWPARRAARPRAARSPCRPRRTPSPGTCGWSGRAGRRRSTPP